MLLKVCGHQFCVKNRGCGLFDVILYNSKILCKRPVCCQIETEEYTILNIYLIQIISNKEQLEKI